MWYMSRLTVYVPREIEKKVRRAAKSSGKSVSRWIADQISNSLAETWPQEILDAAGAFPDFPSVEEIRRGYGPASPRESFD